METTIRFAAASGPLDNPLKGWCTYTGGIVHQPYAMVYKQASWKDLEPVEGKYAFDAWERKTWDGDSQAKGKHIIFRVWMDYPHQPSGVPDWLLQKGVKTRAYTDHGGGNSPDYDDPRLVAGLERLIAALGARYNRNPRVAFLQLGLLGYWGEWHTYPHSDWFASRATQQRVVDAYHRAFPNKHLMARTATDYLGRQPWLGYHDDMIPEDTDGENWMFLPGIRAAGRGENWKTAPLGGEMVPGAAKRWMGPEYEKTRTAVEAAHLSWIGPYNPALEAATPEYLTRSQALVRRMGYEYRLTQMRYPTTVTRGSLLPVALHGENQGVAPFYYPWAVQLALLRPGDHRVIETLPTGADIRKWLPGPFTLQAAPAIHAPAGRYLLGLGIIDPYTGKPAIGFANALPRGGGWTVLAEVRVVAPARHR